MPLTSHRLNLPMPLGIFSKIISIVCSGAAEFEAVVSGIGADADRDLVKSWYLPDENSVPPEYLLRPRTGEFVDLDLWSKLESRLHALLQKAASRASLPLDAMVKYETSATHQEILKGVGPAANDPEHVFAFFRTSAKRDEDGEIRKLKNALKLRLGSNVVEFEIGNLKALCAKVFEKLVQVIRDQAALLKSQPEMRSEIELNDQFAREKGSFFTGREDVLRYVRAYLSGPHRQPMVIHGESGSGKSAIMAQASTEAAGLLPRALVVRRFVGASPLSSDGVSLLGSICRQIAGHFGRPEESVVRFNELTRALQEELRNASPDRPLVLFIDGLNQLRPQDPVSTHPWLPAELPPNCWVVLSTIDVPKHMSDATLVTVKPFSMLDAEVALSSWLSDVGRTLQADQRRHVLESFARCPLPLYLKLAFEEARRWKSFSSWAECVLGEGLDGIIDQTIDRLSVHEEHGLVLVARALSYLSAARHGLAEDEILEVLNGDPEVWEDFLSRSHHKPPERRLPLVVWSRLLFDLKPYLTEYPGSGKNLLSFYHGRIADRISDRFLGGESKNFTHKALAQYFGEVADPGHAGEWDGNSARALSELPFHLAGCGDSGTLDHLLTSLPYLAARVGAGDAYQLSDDYARSGGSAEIAAWREFILRHSQRLTDHSNMLVPLVQLEGFASARAQVDTRNWRQPWLRSSPEPAPMIALRPAEFHVEIEAIKDFPRGRIGTIAREARLIFSLARLGVLCIIDCRNMQELLTQILIGNGRPLKIACAPDASSLLVIFESGRAELHRLSLGEDGLPIGSRLVGHFQCSIPEIDDPVAEWCDGAYWLQMGPAIVGRVDAETALIKETPLPGNMRGELAAMLFLPGGRQFFAVREHGATSLAGADGVSLRREPADLCAACVCGDGVAVAFTNGQTMLYELTPDPLPSATVKTGVIRGALGWDGQRLLWLEESSPDANLRAWRPGDEESYGVQAGQKLFQSGLQVIPSAWLRAEDDTCIVLTSHSMARFRLSAGTSKSVGRIEWLFGGSPWRAVRRQDNTQWLWESQPLRETCLGTDIPGRLYCAPDGRARFFTARVDRPGLVWNLADLQTTILQYSPVPLNMAAGDPDSGCWFSDRKGGIYYAGDERQMRLVATVDEGSGAILHVCGEYLLWRGYIPHFYPGTGVDHARAFVFFRRKPGHKEALERIGERLFSVREGLCVALDYSNENGKLAMLWHREGKEPVLRIANAVDFLGGRFVDHELHGVGFLGQAQMSFSPDGLFLGIVNMGGAFVCVDVNDGETIATLAGSLPFTHVAPAERGERFWLAQDKDVIYSCTLVRPT